MPSLEALRSAFFDRPAELVARELLGAILVSTLGGERTVARIVETEAYIGPEDAASHAAERIGRTARNEAMFGPPGIAYVYKIYGIHWCLNAVTGREKRPAAVLIRAAEPLEGLEVMRGRRQGATPGGRSRSATSADEAPPRIVRDRDLARGPGRLCQALGITGALDGHRLADPPLVLVRGSLGLDERVAVGPRIGITRAKDWPLRFWVEGSRWVSR